MENIYLNLDFTSKNSFGNLFNDEIPIFPTLNRIKPLLYKKGGNIKIKKKNVGSFTKYCGGNVTSECIKRGKNSPDPKIRKKAVFAENSRKWNHA